jgi:ribosomal protein L11 methyltransferase
LKTVRLGIRVRADRAEVALAQLLPILGGGAEERELDGAVEYALYAYEDELPPLEEVRALAGDALVEVRTEPVADGWDVRWHEHLRPVRVGDLVVRAPWLDGSPGDLVIDPGTAFGAGTHATTQLCLELLQVAPAGGALCDWGAGTGVLAIAAARLGWDPVTAVELDPAALEVIRANAARNRVAVEARTGDVREGAPWAPTVVANLPLPTLAEAARALAGPPGTADAAWTTARAGAVWPSERAGAVCPSERAGAARLPARVIAAGMLAHEADEVAAAFGLRERRRVEEDGWAALMLE